MHRRSIVRFLLAMSDLVTQEFLKHTEELAQEINDVVQVLCKLLTSISDLIEKIKYALDSYENPPKYELAKLKHLVVKTQISFSTLFDRVSRMLEYAEADENWMHKIEKSLSNGNPNPFICYIKQLRRYLEQTVQCHQDYLDFYVKANSQYTVLVHISNCEVKLGGKTTALSAVAGGIATSATVAMSGAPVPIIVTLGVLGGAVSAAVADIVTKAQKEKDINGEKNIMAEIKLFFSDAHDMNLNIKERIMTMMRLLDLILGNKVQPLVTNTETNTEAVPGNSKVNIDLLYDAMKQSGDARKMDQSIDLPSFTSAFAELIKCVQEAHQKLTRAHNSYC